MGDIATIILASYMAIAQVTTGVLGYKNKQADKPVPHIQAYQAATDTSSGLLMRHYQLLRAYDKQIQSNGFLYSNAPWTPNQVKLISREEIETRKHLLSRLTLFTTRLTTIAKEDNSEALKSEVEDIKSVLSNIANDFDKVYQTRNNLLSSEIEYTNTIISSGLKQPGLSVLQKTDMEAKQARLAASKAEVEKEKAQWAALKPSIETSIATTSNLIKTFRVYQAKHKRNTFLKQIIREATTSSENKTGIPFVIGILEALENDFNDEMHAILRRSVEIENTDRLLCLNHFISDFSQYSLPLDEVHQDPLWHFAFLHSQEPTIDRSVDPPSITYTLQPLCSRFGYGSGLPLSLETKVAEKYKEARYIFEKEAVIYKGRYTPLKISENARALLLGQIQIPGYKPLTPAEVEQVNSIKWFYRTGDKSYPLDADVFAVKKRELAAVQSSDTFQSELQQNTLQEMLYALKEALRQLNAYAQSDFNDSQAEAIKSKIARLNEANISTKKQLDLLQDLTDSLKP